MAYDRAFQTKVFPLVRQAITTALTTVAGGRIYWLQAPDDATYPYVVFQSQDAGGKRNDYMSANGWRGLITFRVYSTDPDTADTTLQSIPTLLDSVAVSTYTFRALPETPVPYPPQEYGGTRVYTAAMICAAELA